MERQYYLSSEAKAWVKRKSGPDEVIKIIPDSWFTGKGLAYELYSSFVEQPDYLGRILFDVDGYWIYDGNDLTVDEQEQVARFITYHKETM